MMTKREKLYFLVDHIEEDRAITPSGQPILVDPTNNLNRRISGIELKQLFYQAGKGRADFEGLTSVISTFQVE